MIITVPQIIEVVSDFYGMTPSSLTSKTRMAKFIKARHVSIYLAKELTGLSLAEIVRYYPCYVPVKHDKHDTILHAVRSISDQMETNAILKAEVRQLHNMLLKTINQIDCSDFFGFQENDFYGKNFTCQFSEISYSLNKL